jgi:hypothetical protein
MRKQTILIGWVVSAATLAYAFAGGSSESSYKDVWQPYRLLVGEWRGEGSGFGVVSDVTHDWAFVMDGKFLRLKTRSVPRNTESSAEAHEDFGYLSLDTDRDVFVFRQFLSEGFVNTFEVTADADGFVTMVFEYRETESAGGMRARMLLKFVSQNEYEMVLELAGSGKDFTPCQNMRMRKIVVE